MSNPYLPIDQKLAGDGYTSSEAMHNLTVLCDDFGSRFGGTEGEKLAAEYIKTQLESYGLSNVHLEEIPYTGWRRGQVKLEIIEPIQKEIPCISLPYSPPAKNLEATLIDVGNGSPNEFAAVEGQLDGKIVMANSVVFPPDMKRWVHRSEKFNRSLINGAVGFIFMNHYPAYGPATGGIGFSGQQALMPGISVSYEDGAFLQRLLKRKGEVKLRISATDQCQPMISWNIIGDLVGNKNPDEIVMLGSHYDGHDISQGAQDPASGAVAVMETARLLSQHADQLPCTVRFALWGIEEIGLLGSHAYVKAHIDELDQIRFYFNMDGAGSVKNKGVSINEWPEIETLITDWKQDMALDFGTKQSVNAFSDHYPFLLQGVPTGGLESVPRGTGGRGYGHTRYDTLDKVSIRELQDAAVFASRLTVRFASEENWPVARRSLETVNELLNSPDYQDAADFRKEVAAFYAANQK